jgi:hypothetical protein
MAAFGATPYAVADRISGCRAFPNIYATSGIGLFKACAAVTIAWGLTGQAAMSVAIDASEKAAFPADRLTGSSRANIVDRWIYVFTTASILLIVLVGFIPDSVEMVAAVRAGVLPPFPIVLHIHAVLMGSFLLLLFVQSFLVAAGKCHLHMQLGIVGIILAPALLITGLVLVPTMYQFISRAAQNAPAPARPQFQFLAHLLENVLLVQIRIGLAFGICMWVALWNRKSDVGLHKRLIILAIASALPAAFDRMDWLPNTMPGSPLGTDIYTVLAFSPMLIWDLARNGRLHRAYLVWASIFLPASLVVYALWDKPGWHAVSRQIMGS